MSHQHHHLLRSRRRGIATAPLIAGCCGLAAASLGLLVIERNRANDLNRDRAQTAAALDQAKSQIQNLNTRLNTLAEMRAEPAPVPSPPRPAASPAPAKRLRTVRAPAPDPRITRLQGELADTRKDLSNTQDQLATTQDQLAKDKDELSGQIDSARDDLNGSIAKTHDEVVALEKRGEQNVYEFKLTKSKTMQRVGPVSLALRGASAKHNTYDLAMLVEDNTLNKKHINLYEPVWITLTGRPRPVQLVVNHVGKNEVDGYITEPKYKNVELAANPQQPAPAQPPEPSSAPQPPPQQQPAQQQQLMTRGQSPAQD
ncbi:MAG TPA: hypothetical protein VMU19_02225 [Bryobacteraceae bacterium]|nr:hypothetical protein [Bryobacteraceae bacterium]